MKWPFSEFHDAINGALFDITSSVFLKEEEERLGRALTTEERDAVLDKVFEVLKVKEE